VRGFLLELGAFFLKKRPQKQLKKPETKALELQWSGDAGQKKFGAANPKKPAARHKKNHPLQDGFYL
jgi:hypothetical protein